MKKKILLSVVTYIIVMVLLYLAFSFVRLEFDFHTWSLDARGGFVVFGTVVSMLPISAIWIFGVDNF